jgi:hypothetical protein
MDSSDSSLSLDKILNIVIDELVRSRLRNRALLRVLLEREIISRAEYVQAYRDEESENFEAVCDMLLLPVEEFKEKHSVWLERERERFGFTPTSYAKITLTPQIPAASEPLSAAKKKRKRNIKRVDA